MFERLTRRSENGVAYAPIGKPPSFVEITGISADRLAAYEDSGLSPEELQELAKAKAEGRISPVKCPCDASEEAQELMNAKVDGRLVELPCKVGDTYSGICREIVPNKKGWKTKEWIETGIVVRFIVTAELTAEKVDYNHRRNIDEVGEVWFVGEGHRETAEKAIAEVVGND